MGSVLSRYFGSFFLSFLLNENGISQGLIQVLRNSSYGVKEVASRSARNRSLASSRSSIVSIISRYSSRLRTTAFFSPFLSTRYCGLSVFEARIFNLRLRFNYYIKFLSIIGQYEKGLIFLTLSDSKHVFGINFINLS